MLKVNTTGETREIIVTGSAETFKGTALEGADFTFRGRTLNPAEAQRLEKDYIQVNRKGIKVDSGAISRAKFMLMVQSWGGVCGADGKAIPCNEDTKTAISENDPDITRLVVQAIEESADIERVTAREDVEN
jgi:hypothetical protein